MSTTETKSGLIANGRTLPLEGVRVDGTLRGAGLEVTLTQRFRNDEAVPIEAVYVFPLEEGAAVCGFAALVNGELVRGRVEEREQAFARYDDALMDGHAAFLLDQERPDVFTASVGNLRPGEMIELQIRYVALSQREGDGLRVSIPTTVSPRYTPANGRPEVGEPDRERVNPKRWPTVPVGLTLAIDVALGGPLAGVESPSHPIRTTLRDDGARVELAQADVALDRDVVILITPRDRGRPYAMVARDDDGRHVAMVSFLPDVPEGGRGADVVFLLDCSGSMEGTSIEEAKRALLLCIRALGPNDRFDVVRFGNTFHALWGESRPFDEESLAAASRHVAGISADLGGTDILAPLTSILNRRGLVRVLLLTDGQVSNEAEVIALAGAHASHAKIFGFAIGAGPSEHLVRGVARASRGAAEMIAPGERIEPKVMRTFARVRSPAWDDVRVEWGGLQVEEAPRRPPPVFAGDVLTVLARIEAGQASEVSLVAGERRWTVSLDLEGAMSGGPLPTLWARERIRELEDSTAPRGSAQERPELEARRRAQIVELGVRYGLVSSATSFVAVAERAPDDRSTVPASLRRIPIALTSGWGGRDRFDQAGSASGLGAAVFYSRAPRSLQPGRAAPGPSFLARAGAALIGRSVAEVTGEHPTFQSRASRDPVFELLMTQQADGSFGRGAALDDWLGPRAARLDVLIKEHGEAIAITVVVIGLLEAEAADRQAEWTPAVAKARRFLAGRGGAIDLTALLAP